MPLERCFFHTVCAVQSGVFLRTFFLYDFNLEVFSMTMVTREPDSIWTRVRPDIDIDDLIYNYDGTHPAEERPCSDR